MDFKGLKRTMEKHVNDMFDNNDFLFLVNTDPDTLWEIYLESFPPGTNNIFRERREHDCSCCRHFIRSFGNVIAIKDYKIISIWDFDANDNTYQPVINNMSKYVHCATIKDVYMTNESHFGTDYNFEQLDNGLVQRWDHFYIKLPKKFIASATLGQKINEYRTTKQVFKRSLEELSKESIDVVLDLINQNSLYKGEEWKEVLKKFDSIRTKYFNNLSEDLRDNFCWIESVKEGGVIGKIRNHSIGTLLIDISNDVDINEAVRKYEAIVAPTNYKRPKAIFTKKMIEGAQKTITELGYLPSLGRRYATIEDITINNILFANRDSLVKMKGDIFSELQVEIAKPQKFDKTEEVTIETFVKDILPSVTNIELFLENRHQSNLVSIIAPTDKTSKTMFKWNNNFSWAYTGNITDSMKQRVKAAGGNVEGVLRFSIQWNENNDNQNDFDAHCIEPNGNEIFFGNKKPYIHPSTGQLDVDIIDPRNKIAVENITWTNINKMQEGFYRFFVNNYNHCGGRSGFTAEIEYEGQIYSYVYNSELKHKENITVANIMFSKKEGIKFVESLPSSTSSKTIWNLNTNQFQPVYVFMYSPNYWDEQKGIGNKHYIFILNNCINDESPNGFFNEFLKEELMPHKRVFEALGSKMRVEPSNNQLSGLGFSSTQRNSIVCKVSGNFTRTIRILL